MSRPTVGSEGKGPMSVDRFFTRLNPVVVWALRSPLHGLLSKGLMLITVVGRRSGRRYTIPVGYQRHGSTLTVLVSEAPRKQWWRNYGTPTDVEIELAGRRRRGQAAVVDPMSTEFRDRVTDTLRRLPWMGRVFGIDYDRHRGLDETQLAELRRGVAAVQITLDDTVDSD